MDALRCREFCLVCLFVFVLCTSLQPPQTIGLTHSRWEFCMSLIEDFSGYRRWWWLCVCVWSRLPSKFVVNNDSKPSRRCSVTAVSIFWPSSDSLNDVTSLRAGGFNILTIQWQSQRRDKSESRRFQYSDHPVTVSTTWQIWEPAVLSCGNYHWHCFTRLMSISQVVPISVAPHWNWNRERQRDRERDRDKETETDWLTDWLTAELYYARIKV